VALRETPTLPIYFLSSIKRDTANEVHLKFISVQVRNAVVMHGYTPDNKEIAAGFHLETFLVGAFSIASLGIATSSPQ